MLMRRRMSSVYAVAALGLLWAAVGYPRVAVDARQQATDKRASQIDWKTYGADLASTRYAPLDQINSSNFSKLEVAWKVTTESFLYSATPLFVGNTVYTTIGSKRTVAALNPATGAVLW